MPLDNQFLDELRLMFLEGATPSRLIRHIAHRYRDEDNLHGIMQACFFQAFGVGPVRISRRQDLTQLDENLCCSLNDSLIVPMIENSPAWASHLTTRAEPFWNDLNINSDAAPSQESIPELAESWDQLEPSAQTFLRRILSNLEETFLQVQILNRLAERQQRHIAELERQNSSPPLPKP